jgi:hypothetical protein
MNVILNSIFGNMLYGEIKTPTKKDPTYCNLNPNLHKRNHLLAIECKDKSYMPKQGGCMQIPKNHRSWKQRAIKSLPIKIQ